MNIQVKVFRLPANEVCKQVRRNPAELRRSRAISQLTKKAGEPVLCLKQDSAGARPTLHVKGRELAYPNKGCFSQQDLEILSENSRQSDGHSGLETIALANASYLAARQGLQAHEQATAAILMTADDQSGIDLSGSQCFAPHPELSLVIDKLIFGRACGPFIRYLNLGSNRQALKAGQYGELVNGYRAATFEGARGNIGGLFSATAKDFFPDSDRVVVDQLYLHSVLSGCTDTALLVAELLTNSMLSLTRVVHAGPMNPTFVNPDSLEQVLRNLRQHFGHDQQSILVSQTVGGENHRETKPKILIGLQSLKTSPETASTTTSVH